MGSAVPLIKQPIPQPVGERRVVFHSLDWQGYLAIRQSLSTDRNTRLTYSQGLLEITIPLEIHESSTWLIGRFIYILVAELGMDIKTIGSTTLDRSALDRSAEPDAAYYIQNQPLVAGRTIDLDPPARFSCRSRHYPYRHRQATALCRHGDSRILALQR